MSEWPQTIPHDLMQKLEVLDSFRNPPSAQDRWGAIREWLVSHGVEAPDRLPEGQKPDVRYIGHSTPARRQF
jgi:hypothetical protein